MSTAAALGTSSSKLEKAEREFERFHSTSLGGRIDIPSISLRGIQELSRSNSRDIGRVILIDVRAPCEVAVSKVQGALTREEFERENMESLLKERDILVPYCTIGLRSGLYASYLKKSGGYQNVYNGKGMVCFSHELEVNHLIVDPATGKATNRINVHSKQFDLCSERFETCYISWYEALFDIPSLFTTWLRS